MNAEKLLARREAKENTLTFLEQEILYYAMDGHTVHKASRLLNMPEATVEKYRNVMLKKLGANNIAQAIVNALRMDLIDLWAERPIKDGLKINT